ncbi:MAG: preprotein translocase subunit YajC [Pirellulaceae bacterium]|nr:preprotein translocase subunit YajC [Pirellulaceae bacterium]
MLKGLGRKNMFDLNTFCILLAEAPADGAANPTDTTDLLWAFAPWILIGVLFWFIMIRPQKQKADEMKLMLQNLKKNDRVVMTSGIYGTIVNAPKDSDEVTVKVDESNNTRLRVQRNSISRVITTDTTNAETES